MTFPSRNSSGNAFIYVLIAVILFGALSFAITKNQDSNPNAEINAAVAKTTATSILAYEFSARSAIENMVMNGTSVNNINFMLPSNASFNTAPTINKLFHPDGGGLQYKPLPKSARAVPAGTFAPYAGYYVGRFNNYEWTPTSQQDVVFTAFDISKPVCEELSRKNTGAATFGAMTNIRGYIIDVSLSSVANLNMTASACPACDEKPSYCIYSGVGNGYAYYSVLVSR